MASVGESAITIPAVARVDWTVSTPGVPQWYAVYTSSRHEKSVADCLGHRGVHCYVPLYRSVRRWQDRRKEVELPLFPSYVFVQIDLSRKLSVLTAPGVVQIVSFDGKPAPVDESQIDALRRGLLGGNGVKSHPYLKVGKRVRMRSGPLAGVEGILVRRKDNFRLVLSIDLIMRSISVEVDEADVEPTN